ncbi:unnamed protein product, partial [Scytosiphon promiscuus]
TPNIFQTDCSDAFNTGKRTAITKQAAKSIPELVGYIANATTKNQPRRCTRLIRESDGRLIAEAVCSKGTGWGRLCSA